MSTLNYNHLRYFQAVAHAGHLTRAAERMNLSQSALSMQIKTLEERIGHKLFDRVGRTLVLTEAGRIALDYADRIFTAGDELIATLSQQGAEAPPLRVGALSTLSRNFQLQFLRPLLSKGSYGLVLRSGNMTSLMARLQSQELDVVLTTEVPAPGDSRIAATKIADYAIGLHGRPQMMEADSLSALLNVAPVILPSETAARTQFEGLVARLGVAPRVVANVDDMAMVRLLAREGMGLAFAPEVVVADEIKSGLLATAPFGLDLSEPFFAVTLPRVFPHPALGDLLG